MPSVSASNVPDVSTLPVASSSMTAVGGTRPPGPISVGASGVVLPVTSTVAPVISVVVRLVLVAPPERNSSTVPSTSTVAPSTTSAAGAELVKTKIPSLVARSASGSLSCIQNPLVLRRVTTPGTSTTACPSSGERCAAPWMSWIATGSGSIPLFSGAGASAVKSVPFSSVSSPSAARWTDVVFDGAGVGAAPSKSLAVPP